MCAKNGDFSFLDSGRVDDVANLECAKGQWSELLVGTDIEALHKSLPKKGCVLFYSFKRGEDKFFPSIEEELSLAREARTKHRARYSIWIAFIALIVSLLTLVVNALKIDPATWQMFTDFLGKFYQ